MRVFYEGELSAVLEARERDLVDEIHRKDDAYILNINVDEYTSYLVERFSLEIPELLETEIFVETNENMIPAELFPPGFNVYGGKSYPKQVITYHVPFSGDMNLLRYTPSTRLLWTEEMDVRGSALTFDIVVFTEDAESIKRQADATINNLTQQLSNVTTEAGAFNSSLPETIRRTIEARKAELIKRRSVVDSLGVPFRKRDDLPETFAVPPPERRTRIRPEPAAHSSSSQLDPTLDSAVYAEILQTIWDLGTTMERLPSTYAGKDEETLRDHILLYLTPRFEGASTGETFNKSGKTDVLLRYETSNVFIAECKFWSGPKGLLKAIDQLFAYLTWRDSKAALVLFVRNQDFTSVLESIKETVPTHAQFIRHVQDVHESWFEYRLSLPGDPGREAWFSVLAFHLPD